MKWIKIQISAVMYSEPSRHIDGAVHSPAVCALCLDAKPLRNSHIVPEFLFKPLYDENHRFHKISTNPQSPARVVQKGLREPLLCEDCEQRFSRYESYASVVFHGGVEVNVETKGDLAAFSGLEYRRLKLFFLSLLWRFGVTKIDSYRGLDLGPHGEKLRMMLLADDPGSSSQYPCFLCAVMIDGKHQPEFILPPFRSRFEGQRLYSIPIAGVVFVFSVSSHAPPCLIRDACLQENGSFCMIRRDIRKIPFLDEAFASFGKAERERTRLRSTRG